ncbi:phosphotransferase family protein [Lacihabitans sp. CCS-44]|uniref:phosphotransferase family protein n=1 Tax=Lacihabitans sp. CCS-44 TaxID=2487331 RepID=UPI0020CEA570|nr:phosphotransferase family protein [Lacihabitans sp. CCS-44]MCP9754114.1 phosphotransferase family protein [Lacihabitans sp. CCS-44]
MISDEAKEIRTGEEIDESSLEFFLNQNIKDFGKITGIKQFPGGYSNLTYLIQTQEKSYVLRKPPKGAKAIKGGHNMRREFEILESLTNAGFNQVPKPIFYTADESILGSEFYLMDKLEGTILRNSEFKRQKEYLNSDLMSKLSQEICKTQAELHKIKIENTPLANIGKPDGYISRQVKGWHERYLNAKTDELETEQLVFHWLSENTPNEIKPTLLHNDFKYDNVVFDLENQKILGILDWEMATIGDPRMDIGTSLSYWCEAGDGDFEKNFNLSWLPGNFTREEYVAHYQKINPDVDLSNILYFYVFGLFKNAVIIQQIYARYKNGLTQDLRFANLIEGVKALMHKSYRSILETKML